MVICNLQASTILILQHQRLPRSNRMNLRAAILPKQYPSEIARYFSFSRVIASEGLLND